MEQREQHDYDDDEFNLMMNLFVKSPENQATKRSRRVAALFCAARFMINYTFVIIVFCFIRICRNPLRACYVNFDY